MSKAFLWYLEHGSVIATRVKKSALELESPTRSEVAGQVFCSLEAPRTMTTGMGEFVHVATSVAVGDIGRNWSGVGLIQTLPRAPLRRLGQSSLRGR